MIPMSRLLVVALLGCLVAFSALAADTPQNEIVYRASLGRVDDVKLLLKQGASPDGKNDKGVPLLALAAARKDDEGLNVVKALVEAGAHIDGKDSDGQTALFYAAKQGNQKIVDYLLARGADYYATDNSGNTARNLAYTSGHQDIGVDIDNFVKALSAERAKQYEEFNKAVVERSKPPEPPLVKPATTPDQPDALAALTPEQQAQQAAEQAAAEKQRQDEIKQVASDLAFNNCAFQYWSYISDVKQSTELSPDALDDAVDSYKTKIMALQEQLTGEYRMDVPAMKKISDSAKQRIFNELSGMPSNSYRHEQGIGKEADMQTRCHIAARHWDQVPPPLPPKQPNNAPNQNNPPNQKNPPAMTR